MKTFVMGDIHGAHLALEQCLERSGFDRKKDKLIQLGDVVDGWPYVYECVEILNHIPNLINIKGNHDEWFNQWMTYGLHPEKWLHGGDGTVQSYIHRSGRDIALYQDMGVWKTNLTNKDIPESHISFFKSQWLYYKDEKKRLFIHGGFNRHELLKDQPHHIYYWDRDLWLASLSAYGIDKKEETNLQKYFKIKEPCEEIFIGHTATTNWNKDTPMQAGKIWNLDTGSGFKGRLTIMDVDTKEYWQSDPVQELYPGIRGRNL